jgi:hypothetical protein
MKILTHKDNSTIPEGNRVVEIHLGLYLSCCPHPFVPRIDCYWLDGSGDLIGNEFSLPSWYHVGVFLRSVDSMIAFAKFIRLVRSLNNKTPVLS